MKRFTQANTYGYDDDQIEELNALFDTRAEAVLQQLAEQVQREYDNRGA